MTDWFGLRAHRHGSGNRSPGAAAATHSTSARSLCLTGAGPRGTLTRRGIIGSIVQGSHAGDYSGQSMERHARVLTRRGIAFVLDLACVWGPCLALFLAIASAVRTGTAEAGGPFIEIAFRGTERYVEGPGVYALVVFLLALTFLVFAVVPALTGATAGMKLAGLRVVRGDGAQVSLPRHLVRTVLWIVDAFPYLVPAVALLFAATTRGQRRLGDLVARTSVVRATPARRAVAAAIVSAGIACLVSDGAFIASSSFQQTPRELAQEYGAQGDAYPVATIYSRGGTFSFVVGKAPDRLAPCMNYIVPGMGGGVCFFASARKCGWALEAYTSSSGPASVAYGAAVPRAATIRFGHAGTIPAGRIFSRFGLRFFASAVPRAFLHVPQDDIVALDARGRLLGRQHYNDGHGGFGAFDGLIDRACAPRGRT